MIRSGCWGIKEYHSYSLVYLRRESQCIVIGVDVEAEVLGPSSLLVSNGILYHACSTLVKITG